MKLLLTSSGLSNKAITEALFDLVGKKPQETIIVFIPTAANVETGNKDWLIEDLHNFYKQDFAAIHIVDIAAVERAIWLPQIQQADVVCFGGGDQVYLLRTLINLDSKDELLSLLSQKVYVGISAGSMVAGKFLHPEVINFLYPDGHYQTSEDKGLGLVDLAFIPHLNSSHFKRTIEKNLEPMKDYLNQVVYACDDETALKIIDGNVEIVGSGDIWSFIKE